MRATLRIRDKGFTLIELLVALSLLSIGLLAAAAMQGVAINADSLSNRMTAMASLGQEVLEDVMSMPRNDPKLKTSGSVTAVSSRTIEGAGTFTASYNITPDTPIPNVSRVVITVTRDNVRLSGLFNINSAYTVTCFKRVEPSL